MVVEKYITDDVLQDLGKYLRSSRKTKESFNLALGFSSSVLEMTSSKSSVKGTDNLLGSNDIENALVRQWLEYASLYGPYINKSNVIASQVLKELNGVLSRQSFLVKNIKTVADVVLFYLLWNVMSSLSFQEKELFLNLSRWFNTLQQDDKIRQSRKLICFSRTLLY